MSGLQGKNREQRHKAWTMRSLSQKLWWLKNSQNKVLDQMQKLKRREQYLFSEYKRTSTLLEAIRKDAIKPVWRMPR